MKTIDRYIAFQYLLNVLMLLVILFAIFVGVDFSLNFDEYIKAATRLAAESGGTEQIGVIRRSLLVVVVALDLWWPRFFLMYNYLLGLVLVGGMGFTLAQMVRHRELVAMLAGGMSLARIARPILVIAFGLTVLQLANRELVVPRLAELLTRDKDQAGSKTMSSMPLRLSPDAKGRLFYSRAFDPEKGTLATPYIIERDENGIMSRRITADSAVWRDGGWQFTNGIAERREGDTVIREAVTFLQTDLDPTLITLRRYEGYRQNLSTRTLTELIARSRAEGAKAERIESLDHIRFSRIGIMLSNLLALLVCLPFFLCREPANMILRSLYCAPVALFALVGGTLGSAAAIPGLPPAIAAFVPTMILMPGAIAAMTSIKT
jgi:lipopolysaccharide export system permease protein